MPYHPWTQEDRECLLHIELVLMRKGTTMHGMIHQRVTLRLIEDVGNAQGRLFPCEGNEMFRCMSSTPSIITQASFRKWEWTTAICFVLSGEICRLFKLHLINFSLEVCSYQFYLFFYVQVMSRAVIYVSLEWQKIVLLYNFPLFIHSS